MTVHADQNPPNSPNQAQQHLSLTQYFTDGTLKLNLAKHFGLILQDIKQTLKNISGTATNSYTIKYGFGISVSFTLCVLT